MLGGMCARACVSVFTSMCAYVRRYVRACVRACTCLLLCALIFVSAWACMHYKSLDDGPCISYHSDSNNVTSTLA